MPRFDPDTIAALAEGRLDAEGAGELEIAIAANPAASAELAAHRRALDAARSAQPPTLSAAERTMLRATVAAALGGEAAALAPAKIKRRHVPWAAISVAAAAFAALVAIAPLAHLLSAGEESASAPTLGALDELDTTTTPSLDATAELGLGQVETPTPAGTDTADNTSTTAGATATDGTSQEDEDTRKRLTAAFDALVVAGAESPTDDTPCLAAGRSYLGDVPLLTASFTALDDVTLVAFYVAGNDDTVIAAIGFDPADCSVRVTYP